MIAESGSDMFRDGVPCIRERKEGSAALNELALIYANSASRVLSSAEISKQAERVTELLYQLKEEGIDFPGRMRDHVAAACSISTTKLARLHAIRENLIEGLMEHFDDGTLSETAAYELQKLPPELQQSICLKAEKGKSFFIPADSAKNCVDAIEEYTSPKPANTAPLPASTSPPASLYLLPAIHGTTAQAHAAAIVTAWRAAARDASMPPPKSCTKEERGSGQTGR